MGSFLTLCLLVDIWLFASGKILFTSRKVLSDCEFLEIAAVP